MGLRTPEQYLHGLRDGREVYYQGRKLKVVTEHPDLAAAARHASIDFGLAENPEFRDLAVHQEGNETYSAYYRIPRDSTDLLSRSKLIGAGTAAGATLVILIKEIGTDAIFALTATSQQKYAEGLARLDAFYKRCREKGLSAGGSSDGRQG